MIAVRKKTPHGERGVPRSTRTKSTNSMQVQAYTIRFACVNPRGRVYAGI